MTPQEYILSERAKGTPESQIQVGLQSLSSTGVPSPKETSWKREIPSAALSVAGGMGGAILGSALGPVGTVAGATLGAGLFGTGGEILTQEAEKIGGIRTKSDVPQAAASGITSAAGEIIGGGIVGPALKVGNKSMVKFLSKMSSYSDELIEKAMERAPETVQGLSGGDKYLSKVVKSSIVGVQEFVEKQTTAAKTAVKEFTKEFPGAVDKTRNFLDNIAFNLEDKYKIGIGNVSTRGGQVVPNSPLFSTSNIVSEADRTTIRNAFSAVKKLSSGFSIDNVDTTIGQLVSYLQKTPKGMPTGPETKKIITEMIDEIITTVDDAGKNNPAFAKYAKFLKEGGGSAEKRKYLNDIREIFGSTKNPSPVELDKITGRLLSLYNTGKVATREAVEKATPGVSETVAGTLLKEGGKQGASGTALASVQTAKTNILNLVPDYVVRSFAETGNFIGLSETLAKKMGISAKTAGQLILQSLLVKTDNPQQ